MTDQAPLDARVVARILRRAGEIEVEVARAPLDDVGAEAAAALVAAAEEVGLSVDAVRRSIAIERLGPLPRARPGDRIFGPAQVSAEGEIDVSATDALVRVDAWLVDGHHLRRDALRPGRGSWSKRSGLMGATVRTIRNATGEGKLGDVAHVDAAARDTGGGTSVVRITVDRVASRRLASGGSTVAAVGGTAGVVIAAVAAAPVALLATPVAVVAGVGVAVAGRRRAQATERELQRLLAAIEAGADPTRLSVDLVRRASGRADSGRLTSAACRRSCRVVAGRARRDGSACRDPSACRDGSAGRDGSLPAAGDHPQPVVAAGDEPRPAVAACADLTAGDTAHGGELRSADAAHGDRVCPLSPPAPT